MKIAFVVGDPWRLRETHSTVHLAHAALGRGHDVAFVRAGDLSLQEATARSPAIPARVRPDSTRRAFVEAVWDASERPFLVDLLQSDLILLRFNPFRRSTSAEEALRATPLDLAACLQGRGVTVLNDPQGLRASASKATLLELPGDVRPRSVISRDPAVLGEFIERLEGDVVLKPLCGAGGLGVFRFPRQDRGNIDAAVELLAARGYVMAQEFVREAGDGDRRLLLVDGEPLRIARRAAIYRRTPSVPGSFRGNLRAGGRPAEAAIGAGDTRLLESLGPFLRRRGIALAAVDIAGDRILDVNVFSPGGVGRIHELYGLDAAAEILARLERRVG